MAIKRQSTKVAAPICVNATPQRHFTPAPFQFTLASETKQDSSIVNITMPDIIYDDGAAGQCVICALVPVNRKLCVIAVGTSTSRV